MAAPKVKSAAAKAETSVIDPAAIVAETAKAVEEAVAAGKEHIEKSVAAHKETVESVVKASQDAASKGYEKAVALTKDQVEAAVKAQTVAYKSYEDVVLVAKENVDAMVKAGTILTKGFQEIAKQVIGLTQESFEEGVSASKALFGAKTLREVLDLQSSLAKNGLDKFMAEGTRLSDQSVKLIEEAFAPINDRVTATVSKVTKLVKAA